MKKALFFSAILFCFVNVQAADTSNVAVNFTETEYSIMYYGPAVMASDGGTDNCTTQWMLVDFIDFATNLGTIQLWCSDSTGTEDVNVYVQFSNSDSANRFFSLATDPDLDALSTSVVWDTVGIALGKRCYGTKYMRLKFDGQTGNPNGTAIHWYIFFLKPDRPSVQYRGAVGNTL